MTVIDHANKSYQGYRIKIQYSLQINGKFWRTNEFIFPQNFTSLGKAQEKINQDIEQRLKEGNFFRSYIYGFDLVRYSNVACKNTFIAYKIVPIGALDKKRTKKNTIGQDIFGV